jgi:phage baseplate assembly protein W
MSFDLKIENNGLVINPDGTLQTVSDNSKLIQDIIKALLTPLGSNRFYRWYGNALASTIIGEDLDSVMIEIEAERSIQDTLSNIIILQKEQAKTQYISAGETIAAIRNISVVRDSVDPRQYQITVSALTRKLTVVEETFFLRV